MHSEIRAPAATAFPKLFSCLYTMGNMMPPGMNIAALPATFQMISRTVP